MKYSRVSMESAVVSVSLPSTNDLAIKQNSNFQRRKFTKKQPPRRGAIPTRYKLYIKSKWWTKRKHAYYRTNPRQCAVCRSRNDVNLHRKVYGNYGHEKDEHLIPLCGRRHMGFHVAHGIKGNMVHETQEYIHGALFDEEAGSIMKNI